MEKLRYLEQTIQLSLDTNTCIGCGQCLTVCPHRVFILAGEKAAIHDRGACMECGACVLNCPVEAIYVNPDEGCGCATLIIKGWFAALKEKRVAGKR